MDVQPQLGLEVSQTVAVNAGWLVFWRREIGDGIYTWSGQLLRSAAGTHSRFVGNSPSVTFRWTLNPHLTLSSDLSGFTAKPFIRESGRGEDSRSFARRSSIAFRLGAVNGAMIHVDTAAPRCDAECPQCGRGLDRLAMSRTCHPNTMPLSHG
jgi:hypothetical protein